MICKKHCKEISKVKHSLIVGCDCRMVAEKKARELGLQVTGVTGNDGTTLILAVGPGIILKSQIFKITI